MNQPILRFNPYWVKSATSTRNPNAIRTAFATWRDLECGGSGQIQRVAGVGGTLPPRRDCQAARPSHQQQLSGESGPATRETSGERLDVFPSSCGGILRVTAPRDRRRVGRPHEGKVRKPPTAAATRKSTTRRSCQDITLPPESSYRKWLRSRLAAADCSRNSYLAREHLQPSRAAGPRSRVGSGSRRSTPPTGVLAAPLRRSEWNSFRANECVSHQARRLVKSYNQFAPPGQAGAPPRDEEANCGNARTFTGDQGLAWDPLADLVGSSPLGRGLDAELPCSP